MAKHCQNKPLSNDNLGLYVDNYTNLFDDDSQKSCWMQSGDATSGIFNYSIKSEWKQTAGCLAKCILKEDNLTAYYGDWTGSNQIGHKRTEWCKRCLLQKGLKRAGNSFSLFLRSASFCMTTTHSSVFAFIELLYALMWLNWTLTKCTSHRKSCRYLTLKQHKQIWSTDTICLANVFSFSNLNSKSKWTSYQSSFLPHTTRL